VPQRCSVSHLTVTPVPQRCSVSHLTVTPMLQRCSVRHLTLTPMPQRCSVSHLTLTPVPQRYSAHGLKQNTKPVTPFLGELCSRFVISGRFMSWNLMRRKVFALVKIGKVSVSTFYC
jgi:hypothetical protein